MKCREVWSILETGGSECNLFTLNNSSYVKDEECVCACEKSYEHQHLFTWIIARRKRENTLSFYDLSKYSVILSLFYNHSTQPMLWEPSNTIRLIRRFITALTTSSEDQNRTTQWFLQFRHEIELIRLKSGEYGGAVPNRSASSCISAEAVLIFSRVSRNNAAAHWHLLSLMHYCEQAFRHMCSYCDHIIYML